MPDKKHLAVIGGGIGGYTAAIRAARNGFEVTLIEKETLGGTCLNVGCIPTKSLLHNSGMIAELAAPQGHEVEQAPPYPDLQLMMNRKSATVSRLVGGVETLIKRNAITSIAGTAELTEEKNIRVQETGQVIKADTIVIATGSKPFLPPIEGIDLPGVIVSDEAISLNEIPRRIMIIGGGVIGVEFAQIFANLGSEVKIIELADRLLAGEDPEIVDVLEQSMRRQGVEFRTDTRVLGITKEEHGLVTNLEQSGVREEIESDIVLLAVGRKPNLMPDLETAGIEIIDGAIRVDEWQRTNVSSIYAIGDVCGGPLLAHKAAAEAEAALAHMLSKGPSMRGRVIPRGVYTSPEIASVGLSEDLARAQGLVKIGRFPFSANGKALIKGHAEGLVKIVADEEYEQILGISMVGPGVTELLGEATMAVQMELTLTALAQIVHAHPSLSEAFTEAAHDALDHGAIHIPPRTSREPVKPSTASPG